MRMLAVLGMALASLLGGCAAHGETAYGGNPRAVRAERSSHDGNPRAVRAERSSHDGRFSWGAALRVPEPVFVHEGTIPQARDPARDRAEKRVTRLSTEMPAILPMNGTVLLFDLSRQRFAAYEDGVIAQRGDVVVWGPISSGMRGHRTPTGTFRVEWKTREHISTKYPARRWPQESGGAVMPHAVFFTKSGEAIHAGDITRPFASHGCIRVSVKMEAFLWR